jgi:iron complex outermembrane recepter protein
LFKGYNMTFDKSVLLATTIVAGLAFASPTFAQTQPEQTSDEEERAAEDASSDRERIVVTGSRIRRSEFTSSQPVQIITAEEATLEGLVDTSEILQGSTIANTAGQINNYFTGSVLTGGPGVNTLSLRGLGAERTLVLLNGRRAGPAGARGPGGPPPPDTNEARRHAVGF